MSEIGAALPPHLLAKRKRQQEKQSPAASTTTSGAKRASPSPDGAEKRRRVIGPAMPPAPVDEQPAEPPNNDVEESSDDDDFGPSLPGENTTSGEREDDSNNAFAATNPTTPEKAKRDDWMTMPPKQDDLAARMDPSIQRPRAFNTGKGSRAPNAGADDNSSWHETPEQKRKRLADEMMGINTASGTRACPQPAKSARENDAHRKIKEHVDKTRGPSLMDRHKQATKNKETEDDPSKRAFDREKDMGHGGRMSSVQKNDMLKKAAGFSGKFSGGSYL